MARSVAWMVTPSLTGRVGSRRGQRSRGTFARLRGWPAGLEHVSIPSVRSRRPRRRRIRLSAPAFDQAYQLEHRYTRERGRVYLTGVQALVRLPLLQRERDLAAGLSTAGFISGYRGSPLGTYDLALWQAREQLESHHVRFEPGVNEDLAATAVAGTQQANLHPGPKYDGVFAIWYGKGPGVDRSCDAIKHGNYAGTAKHGGVLALCGDDPGAKSSSIAHQDRKSVG